MMITEGRCEVSCVSMDYSCLQYLNDRIMNDTNTTMPELSDTLEQFTKGLYTYGIPVICIFGIFGNMLSFRVFAFTSFGKQNSSVYIQALSLSDTGFLASLILSWLGGGRIGVVYGHSSVWCHVMVYVTYVCSFLSVWYVVLIMADRYIVVCHSLHVPDWCTKKRARVVTGALTLFGVLLYSHLFFTAEIGGDNCRLQFKPFMLRFISISIYADTAITFVIPFAIIFVLNILVIISMKRFQLRHNYLRDRVQQTDFTNLDVLTKAQYHITRTFILVSAVLLVTNVPSHGIRFYIIVKRLVNSGDIVLYHAQHVFQIIYYFNFAVNFLLYSVSSRKFRKYLKCRYLCYCCKKRGRNHLTNEELYRNFHLLPLRNTLQRRLVFNDSRARNVI
ncbi:mu-type opioid receptor-like [Ruditapes philippinarum]|uniref:mu-type opioid receptor-like n=1 Tax=Ruditapes philippinarum TaxID=129788 RepID=UPI00295BF40E|nr:mu-type opioid receptor-like [Ruditapes philippinarum]